MFVMLWIGLAQAQAGDSGSYYLHPIAVGFEFDGVIRADGSIVGYTVPDVGDIDPAVILRFAGSGFFSGDVTDACVVIGSFAPALRACDLDNDDGADLWNSYEGTFSTVFTTCEQRLDPAEWGPDGQDLLALFEGMRLGIGFGEMTPYLEGARGAQSLLDLEGSLTAMYVSMNQTDGTFIGSDWTTGVVFSWDSATGEPVDNNGLLQQIDATVTGAELNEGYLRTFAYWYQDFPLIDFTVLQDQPPGTYDPCPPDTTLPDTSDTGNGTPTDPPDDTDTPKNNDKDDGCGCSASGVPSLGWMALLLMGFRRRR